MKTMSMSSSKIVAAVLAFELLASCPLHAGSLWREGITDERGMCADKRARVVGDVITIVVQETASVNNTLNLTTNKETKGNDGLASNLINTFISAVPNVLIGRKNNASNLYNVGYSGTNKIILPSIPTLSGTGSNSFTGGGSIQNSQTISARVAVQVIDVLPNGNLVVEGVREITFSKERQYASLHGIIRPYDVRPDNTVDSTNVANAQISIVSEGTLTDSQKKGWLKKINDKISPF